MTKRRSTSGVDAIRREIHDGGAKVAYDALLEVCRDRQAPAQARATAGVAVLRAAGMFEKTKPEDEIDEAEMTVEQLQRRSARYAAEIAELEKSIAERDLLQRIEPTLGEDETDLFD